MKKVLVVDDERSIQFAISKAIRFMGYEPVIADGGLNAVKLADETLFDLILLDMKMSDLDGIEALGRIRESVANTSTPVVMVTAYSHINIVESAVKLGANDFVVKPFDLSMIIEKVSIWINARVESLWKKLKPDQEKLLTLTVATINKAFKAAQAGRVVPFHQVQETSEQLIEVMDNGNIHDVLEAVKEHDGYTFVHSLRVGIYMALFAQAMKVFSHDEMLCITCGGVIHDVGKSKIPLEVLNKPTELDEHEMLIMHKHVDYTVEILHRTPDVSERVIEIGWTHHERSDGSGYPRGLKLKEMSICGRMAAIVDAYVALTDRRVYKPAYSQERAFEELDIIPGGLDERLLENFKRALTQGIQACYL